MTDQEIAQAVEKMKREDENHPPEGRLGDLYEMGVINAKGRVFSENLRMVEELLRAKGFDMISAFHRGTMPGGAVRLHEKVAQGREAEGPYEKMRNLIKKARNQESLWKALDAAGYITRPRAESKKKTG